ncbi:histidine kinase CKI1-like [Lycium ferocissimum]|uniref:histidine kinase CKI1-like n=1 Tax=Lycium ferocissimum TaxID=112874 RepID=UPI002815BB2E|nr:histidine kinase CKI1-like [Lycium ferocissimum]
MKLSSFKVPRPVYFCLILSFVMLLVPVVLLPFWVNSLKRVEGNIKVYMSANVQDDLQIHFHNNIKFGFMLIILMLAALAVSLFTFVGLTIRAARREMYLCATLIKQMEATQQAEKKSMNKSNAFAVANHDIRASLAGISGLIDMCRNHASPESELETNLDDMQSCTNDLLDILNSILDQSKIEEGKKQLEEEEFDMEELLEHVVNIYYPKAAMKNVDVLLDPCDASITRFSRVKGDRKEMRSILTNLLDNAVKFTSEGHISLRVWARKAGSDQSSNLAPNTISSIGCMSCFLLQNDVADSEKLQVLNKVLQDPNCVEFVFEVDDTGKGIPKEKQNSVFENYVQVNETDGQTGTGLGLGIIQSLVRLMGGEISIIDKEIREKGTCFRFNIFLIACEPQDQEQQEISVKYSREEDLECQLGGYISSDSYYHSTPSSNNSITSHQKPERSNVILFIKEEERSRVLHRFMMNIGLKVHIVNRHEQFWKLKRKLINFQSKEIPLSALDGTDDDHITYFHKRGRGLNPKGSLVRFILIIIDTSVGQFREISRAMDDFQKGFPKNVSLRVVWLVKPGVDKDKLPSTDVVMAKPLHGSRLYRVLGLVPEFGGAISPTITQEVEDERNSRIKNQTTPIQDVAIDVSGSSSKKLPLTGKRILVVEDDRVQLKVCNAKVSKLGATIYTCGNGKEALAHVCKGLRDQSQIIDYILMDCEMAGMNGFEATKCIREEEAHYGIRIPIIACTAHTEKEKTDKIFQVGMDYYLPKEFNPDELLEAIDYIEHIKV